MKVIKKKAVAVMLAAFMFATTGGIFTVWADYAETSAGVSTASEDSAFGKLIYCLERSKEEVSQVYILEPLTEWTDQGRKLSDHRFTIKSLDKVGENEGLFGAVEWSYDFTFWNNQLTMEDITITISNEEADSLYKSVRTGITAFYGKQPIEGPYYENMSYDTDQQIVYWENAISRTTLSFVHRDPNRSDMSQRTLQINIIAARLIK